MIVGCDFGLRKSGVVLLDSNCEIFSQNLIQVRPSSKGAQRLFDIEQAFDTLIKPIDEETHIFIEGYAYGAKYQRESLAELGGVVRRYLYVNTLDYWVIPPTSIKYFVTGNGNASKNYMKKCTKDKWGISFKSDDICDAYGLARLGLSLIQAIKSDLATLPQQQHQKDILNDIIAYRDQYLNANTSRRKGNLTRRKVNERRKTKTQG